MSKNLVAYFSASGVTEGVAEEVARAAGADLFEIEPVQPYTTADLNWHDSNSRTTIEMKKDQSIRPEIVKGAGDVSGYDTIFIGFPIWWYIAPTIINTYLESGDFSGKKIVLFATSGGSGFGDTVEKLKPSAPGASIVAGKLLNGAAPEQVKKFVETYV